MNSKELKKIIKICKDSGLKSLKTADFELHFENEKVGSPANTIQPNAVPITELSSEPEPTAEQFLYWSTGFDPEIEKAEREKIIKTATQLTEELQGVN